MKRLVLLCLLGLAVASLAACSGPGETPGGAQSPKPRKASVQSTRRLAAGASVTMRNGLTFTVPRGWEATVATYVRPSDGIGGQFGDPDVSEWVLMHRTGGTEHPSSVMLESRDGTSSAIPEGFGQFSQVLSSTVARVWAGSRDFPKPPYRLFIAETRVPGFERGIIYFGGSTQDPQGSAAEIWKLIHLTGAAAPAADN